MSKIILVDGCYGKLTEDGRCFELHRVRKTKECHLHKELKNETVDEVVGYCTSVASLVEGCIKLVGRERIEKENADIPLGRVVTILKNLHEEMKAALREANLYDNL